MVYIYSLFIIACSTFFWAGRNLRSAQEAAYQIGALAVILSMFFFNLKPIKLNRINIWVGIFGLYSLLLFCLSGLTLGNATIFNMFFGILLFYMAQQLNKEDTRIILKVLIGICFLNIVYMLFQRFNFDFIYYMINTGTGIPFENNNVDLIGLTGLKAVMGMWMGLGLVCSLLFSPFLGLVFVIPLYMARCTGVILGLVVSVPFILFFLRRKLFYFIVPLLLIGSIVYIVKVDSPMGMMGTRPPMWKMVLKDTFYGFNLMNPEWQSPFLRNPFTGFGLDSFRSSNIMYFKESISNNTIRVIKTPKGLISSDGVPLTQNGRAILCGDKTLDYWDNPHNEIVQVVYEMGLIGLTIVGFILYYLFKRFKYAVKTPYLITVSALLIFLFVCSFSQFPLHLARIGSVFPVLLGLFMINSENEYGKKEV